MNMVRRIFPLVIILFFSFFAFMPLLSPGFFPMHDNTQVQRVFEMTKSLKDGMFPVRWVEDLGFGYGYPLFNFYNPFPYYLGAVFSLFGFDALSGTKIMMILGILTAGFSMYFLAKEFWGVLGGVLSALFYVYAPYHAVDVYVRGDVAEFWAYAFIPLVFYGFWKIYKEKKWRYVVVTALSYAALICSHNLTAMMATPFILFFIFYLLFLVWAKDKKADVYIISAFVAGLLISSFYWLPAILEMKYTNVLSILGGGSNFRNNFACLGQLWSSPWGYGGSAPGCNDGLSFMIGKYHIILSVLSSLFALYILISNKFSNYFGKEKFRLYIILISFAGFLVSIFFTLQISEPVWNLIPLMAYFQFPWRFLVMVVFFSSFIAGSLFWFTEKYIKSSLTKYLLGVLVFSFIVAVSIKFFVPQATLNKNAPDYTNSFNLVWTTSKISSEYMPKNFKKPDSPAGVANFSNLSSGDLTISTVSRKTGVINLSINANKSSSVILPVAYFPAWKGFLDGKNTAIYQTGNGILVNVQKGMHNLTLKFSQTPLEIFSDLLSIAGILLLFAGIIHLRKIYE